MAEHQNAATASCVVTRLHYHQQRRVLDIAFSDGVTVTLNAELLRVYSPSAEVRRHGNPQLVTNKKQVAISKLLAVGHYAVKLVFDDGHATGVYSWQYLRQLADNQSSLWQDYLLKLAGANANRDALITINVRH